MLSIFTGSEYMEKDIDPETGRNRGSNISMQLNYAVQRICEISLETMTIMSISLLNTRNIRIRKSTYWPT